MQPHTTGGTNTDFAQLKTLSQLINKDDKSSKNTHALATEKARKKAVELLREMRAPSTAMAGGPIAMDLLLTHLTRLSSKKATSSHTPFDSCRLKIHLTGYLLEHTVALNWSENGLQLYMFEEILNRSKREFVHDVALPSAARKLDKKIYSAAALTMSSVRDNLVQLSLWADVVWSPALGEAVIQVKNDVEKLYQQETTPGRVWNAKFVNDAVNALFEDWAKQSADFQAGISNFKELHSDTEFFSMVKGSNAYLPKPYLLSPTTGDMNPVVSALVSEFEDDIRRRVEEAALRPAAQPVKTHDQGGNFFFENAAQAGKDFAYCVMVHERTSGHPV